MSELRPTAVVQNALGRLGFVSHVGEDGHTVYRHEASDTVFLFHRDGPTVLPPLRTASIRRLAVGRGAATERAYDKAVAEAIAATSTPAVPRRPVRARRRSASPLPV